jgi:hypothetical protein
MELKSKDGHLRTEEWNPTAKSHHVPMWFRMKVRKHIRAKGGKPYLSNEIQNLREEHRSAFWDHCASIEVPGSTERVFITQPYPAACDQATAEYWAAALGCRLEIPAEKGVWHPDTSLYIFHPL